MLSFTAEKNVPLNNFYYGRISFDKYLNKRLKTEFSIKKLLANRQTKIWNCGEMMKRK